MTTTSSSDGTEISYVESGAAGADTTPVLLVHGITESRATWDPIIERLSAIHRVIAMDLRGHGESGTADTYDLGAMASDVVAVAHAAGAESPHIVGHSLGGAVRVGSGCGIPCVVGGQRRPIALAWRLQGGVEPGPNQCCATRRRSTRSSAQCLATWPAP